MPQRILRLTIFLVLSFLSSACTTAGLLAINSAARLGADQDKVSDISFGDQPWQRLDIYTPTSPAADLPVLIFFYGGSWDSGSRSDYLFVASTFTELGYVVVIPDYVKYPTGKFPTFVEDGALAVAWVKQNIAEHGGSPDEVFVLGHSAGAHLAALFLTDDSYLAAHGLEPSDLRAFAGLAGPYNFVPEEERYRRIFNPPENYPLMQASNHVNGGEPPMFLARGGDDSVVGPQNQSRLAESLAAHGIEHRTRTYPGVSHVGILLDMAPLLRGDATLVEDIHSFFGSAP